MQYIQVCTIEHQHNITSSQVSQLTKENCPSMLQYRSVSKLIGIMIAQEMTGHGETIPRVHSSLGWTAACRKARSPGHRTVPYPWPWAGRRCGWGCSPCHRSHWAWTGWDPTVGSAVSWQTSRTWMRRLGSQGGIVRAGRPCGHAWCRRKQHRLPSCWLQISAKVGFKCLSRDHYAQNIMPN